MSTVRFVALELRDGTKVHVNPENVVAVGTAFGPDKVPMIGIAAVQTVSGVLVVNGNVDDVVGRLKGLALV